MARGPERIAQSLVQVPIFSAFEADELEVLASHARPRSFKPDEVIFQQDDPGSSFHLIQSGLVKIYLRSDAGRDVAFALLQAGEFFGELSLIDGLPRSASASAIEPTETLQIARDDFLEVLDHHPRAARRICAVLAGRLRRSDGIIADAAFLDLRMRLIKRLLDLAKSFGRPVGDDMELDLRLRQQDLAEIVGATRESINRTLSALAAEGVIVMSRNRVRLVDFPRLVRQFS